MSPKAQGKVSFNTYAFPGARVMFDAERDRDSSQLATIPYLHYLCASTTRDRKHFEAGSRRYLLAGERLQKLNKTEPEAGRAKPIRP